MIRPYFCSGGGFFLLPCKEKQKGVGPLPDYPKSSWKAFGLNTPSIALVWDDVLFKGAPHRGASFYHLSEASYWEFTPTFKKKKCVFLIFCVFLLKSFWKTLWIVNRRSDPLIQKDPLEEFLLKDSLEELLPLPLLCY